MFPELVLLEVDYLKYDNCYSWSVFPEIRYQRMHDALNKTGRPIFFSMCEWGQFWPEKWAAPIANSWRTTGDIKDNWDSVTTILHLNNRWHAHAGPGGWNDPDMLEVGNGGLTRVEEVSHFTLWSLMKAPLCELIAFHILCALVLIFAPVLGFDARTVSDDVIELVTNSEVLAWNQDPLGVQGHKIVTDNGKEVWAGPLSGGEMAVVLFNRQEAADTITVDFKDLGISESQRVHLRDVWAHKNLGVYSTNFSASVESHGVISLHFTPAKTVSLF